jgi:hypothetical protein
MVLAEVISGGKTKESIENGAQAPSPVHQVNPSPERDLTR